MDVEKTLPTKYRMKFFKPFMEVKPNKKMKWYKSLFLSHVTRMDEIQTAVRPKKTVQDVVQVFKYTSE